MHWFIEYSLYTCFFLFVFDRNGKVISASSKYRIEVSSSTHTLVIKNGAMDDIAQYTCVAENVKTQTELELKGADEKLEIDESKLEREVIVTKGQDVTFTVPLVKSSLQKPNVEWKFQGQEIRKSEKVGAKHNI